MEEPDLSAYFARIGYDGPREPTLAVLRALHEKHPAAIPFEAIDVLLDRGIDLSPDAVHAKLIAGGRGGYCFEHNTLFKRVLEALGFAPEGLLARVMWQAPPDAPPRPRTHMTLRLQIEGEPWLADVGFGGKVLPEPLRMVPGLVQVTRHDVYRLTEVPHGLLLETLVEGRWAPVYRLSLEPQHPIDYELANWFTSAHPSSHFRSTLICARTTPEARFGLLQNQFTVRRPGAEAERQVLDADGLERVLREVFGLPVEPAWRPVLERAAAPPEA